ncbi:MAG: 30S ribosomal protein S17e [Nitrosopumilales archaeon]|jgi:small subunit ribosomal protein S17e|nr:30S ribosomal protein S17e [Nitrosopumilales archaeon]MRN60823.1 30S ribosomal protein S17e [Nitrosopumilales archaeon]
MDRIKRISAEILERYPENFGTDFDQNKATLKKIAVVRSKLLRNRIAGFITAYLRRENTEKGSSDGATEPEIQ